MPDINLYLEDQDGQIPTNPACIVVEILSPEDRLLRFLQKLPITSNVWVFDSKTRLMYRCTESGLGMPVPQLTAGDTVFVAPPDLGLQAAA